MQNNDRPLCNSVCLLKEPSQNCRWTFPAIGSPRTAEVPQKTTGDLRNAALADTSYNIPPAVQHRLWYTWLISPSQYSSTLTLDRLHFMKLICNTSQRLRHRLQSWLSV